MSEVGAKTSFLPGTILGPGGDPIDAANKAKLLGTSVDSLGVALARAQKEAERHIKTYEYLGFGAAKTALIMHELHGELEKIEGMGKFTADSVYLMTNQFQRLSGQMGKLPLNVLNNGLGGLASTMSGMLGPATGVAVALQTVIAVIGKIIDYSSQAANVLLPAQLLSGNVAFGKFGEESLEQNRLKAAQNLTFLTRDALFSVSEAVKRTGELTGMMPKEWMKAGTTATDVATSLLGQESLNHASAATHLNLLTRAATTGQAYSPTESAIQAFQKSLTTLPIPVATEYLNQMNESTRLFGGTVLEAGNTVHAFEKELYNGTLSIGDLVKMTGAARAPVGQGAGFLQMAMSQGVKLPGKLGEMMARGDVMGADFEMKRMLGTGHVKEFTDMLPALMKAGEGMVGGQKWGRALMADMIRSMFPTMPTGELDIATFGTKLGAAALPPKMLPEPGASGEMGMQELADRMHALAIAANDAEHVAQALQNRAAGVLREQVNTPVDAGRERLREITRNHLDRMML